MGGRTALRRYPALGFLAVAAALALLLPSKLSSPRSEPASLSEFAPVPGRGDAAGDLSDLGAAGSSGDAATAAGGRGRAGTDAASAPRDPGKRGGSLKRCVGTPPRQTEDPLSPPCVPYFEGSNGGATWRGVTRDEVTVVAYFRRTNTSPSGRGSPPAGSWVDYGSDPSPDDFAWDHSMKVYARYFNDRYQAYARTVHLWGYYGVPFTDADVINKRRTDAGTIDAEQAPFAVLPIDVDPVEPFVDAARSRGMVSVAYDAFVRDFYRDGLMWGVLPDLETQAGNIASYVCAKLHGREARHSGNPLDTGRRLGIVFTESPRATQYAQLKDLTKDALRRGCGASVVQEASASEVAEQGQAQAVEGVARLKAAEVSTVIVIAVSNTVLNYTTAASGAGFFPEWVVPGRRATTGIDTGGAASFMPPDQWRRAFGFTYSPRWGDASEEHWRRSHHEACGCEVQAPSNSAHMYDVLAMLFHGIQAAGPKLTPQSFDKGLHAIPERPAANAYTPSAYFRPGEHTWVKDAAMIWWDGSGTAPGSSSPGCYRIVYDGRRFARDAWVAGDEDVRAQAPCNGHAPVT